MEVKPLISIITVVFNGSKTLEQTIQSVLTQTYKNIEYIIIDGGSTDGTLDIIKKHECKIDFWVSEPDKGLYDAMNKGISKANGELIGMINSDDWYETNAVQLLVEAFNKDPKKKIFHGDRFNVYEDGSKVIRKFHPSAFKFKYYGMTYNHPSMFIHKDIYAVEKYNINLRSLSDYEFTLKNYLKNSETFVYIPRAYVNYRLDGISSQLGIKESILEGFKTRRNAGMNLIQNLFSIIPKLVGALIAIVKLK